MDPATVRVSLADGLAWIEIHRPDKRNALNRETVGQLRKVLLECGVNPECRVMLLTGAGDRAFAAGADIAEMAALDRNDIRALMECGKEVARLLEEASQIALAVVNGVALGGGCELALACDLILAAESAQFALPEVDLGVIPGWGGTQRLQRRVGYGRAREMVFTGARIPAARALEWGLCDRVFPADRLRAEAEALARTLAAKDVKALSAAKRALRAAAPPLKEGLAVETELFVEAFDRPERAARMEAFLRR
jgi:enoyl-CoA hydratase